LLARLSEAGARHIFGMPSDYGLRFYEEITRSPIKHIGTRREDAAPPSPATVTRVAWA
jgi:indolepyruvate decarboxylase